MSVLRTLRSAEAAGKRVFQRGGLRCEIIVCKEQVRGFAERGAGILKVRRRAHSEINARSAAHHRLRIERIGKSQPRSNILAVRRNRPPAWRGELCGAQQFHRCRVVEPRALHLPLHAQGSRRLRIGRQAGQVEIHSTVGVEIAELELIAARGIGRTPLVAQAQIQSEFRIHLPVILDIKASLQRPVGHRGGHYQLAASIDIVAVPKSQTRQGIARGVSQCIKIAVRSRGCDVIRISQQAGRVVRLPEIIVENPLLAADLDQVIPMGNYQLRRVAKQRVAKRSVDAALVVEVIPGQIPLHHEGRHFVDPVGLLKHRRQSLRARR